MKIKNSHIVSLMMLLFAVSSFIVSCTDKPNELVMSQGKMEDVLYDYHIADGIINACAYDSVKKAECINAVFDKHGINREIFDSSMVYYMRHADIMEGIYTHLESRIQNEARLQGVDGGDMNLTSNDAKADTANIWNLERTKVLATEVPYNTMRFDFKADSTFKAGDRFILKFKSDFIYQEGMRNGYAIMAVVLKNDSVVTQTTAISGSMERTLDFSDQQRIGVKEIRGYFMHRPSNNPNDKNSSTVKMMILSNIQLIKMHVNEAPKDEQKPDSLNTNNNEKADTIKRSTIMPQPAG